MSISFFYKRCAPFYDLLWRTFTDRTLKRVLLTLDFKCLAKPQQPKYLLDVACGTGELELRLARLYPKIRLVGLDSSQQMLAQATHKLAGHHHVGFVQGDAMLPLPFSDASFDFVVSANALHYVHQPDKLLREVRRVLRPGGQLVIEDFSVHGSFLWLFFEKLIRLFDPQHYKTYTLSELTHYVQAAGFTTNRSDTFKIDLLWQGMVVLATLPH